MLALAVSIVAVTATGADNGHAVAFKASKLYVGDGKTLDGGVLVVEGPVVKSVGASAPEGVPTTDHQGWITPGLIALHDHSGCAGEFDDETRSVLPEAELVYAFDSDHSDFARAARAGITSIVVVPSPSNLVGGVTAVVKTDGVVVRERAHLSLSVCADSLGLNRFPTSTSGAFAELARRFDEGAGAFGEAVRGELLVLLEARTRADVDRAVDLAVRRGLRGAIVGADRVGDRVDLVRAAGLGAVLGPFDVGQTFRTMDSAKALAAADVPFAFALDAPARAPESLRLGAAMCVRAGAPAEATLDALTSDAARIAGAGDRIGILASGKHADFVLWSGHPLDLSSSVVAVYVGGERVYAQEGDDR